MRLLVTVFWIVVGTVGLLILSVGSFMSLIPAKGPEAAAEITILALAAAIFGVAFGTKGLE